MATRGSAVCDHDDFTLVVRYAEDCDIHVFAEYEASNLQPGNAAIDMAAKYNGGTTGGREASSFNIYLFNRDDPLPDGSARTGGAGTKNSPHTPLPEIPTSSIKPSVPKAGSPNIPTARAEQALAANPAGLGFNAWIQWDGSLAVIEKHPQTLVIETSWIVEWKVGPFPDSDANTPANVRIHQDTTFKGSAELVD